MLVCDDGGATVIRGGPVDVASRIAHSAAAALRVVTLTD
jgi:hypothetical protein